MKIGIVGATGSFGKGLACRWAKNHTIFVGSRSREKGEQKAREYQAELEKFGVTGNLVGASNKDAIAGAEIIVLAVHFEHLFSLVEESYDDFGNKIVICPVVSLKKEESFCPAPPEEGSVALLLQKRLPHSAIVSALHTVPANRLARLDKALEGDVPVCGNTHEAKERTIGLIREIEHLNPIDAGPLDVSRMIESIVPLILNLKQYSLKRNTCIKFI